MLHRSIANEIHRPYRDSTLNSDLVPQRRIKLRKILGISLFSYGTNTSCNHKIQLPLDYLFQRCAALVVPTENIVL